MHHMFAIDNMQLTREINSHAFTPSCFPSSPFRVAPYSFSIFHSSSHVHMHVHMFTYAGFTTIERLPLSSVQASSRAARRTVLPTLCTARTTQSQPRCIASWVISSDLMWPLCSTVSLASTAGGLDPSSPTSSTKSRTDT